jgi:CRP/FNR family transcriptional regulator, cyclic AMP receptor protein
MPTSNALQLVPEIIDSNMLILWGGVFKSYHKDEYVFREGQQPHFYHQVLEGRIKMFNTTDEGKEFIQGFFTAGQSFGEPPLFTKSEYPAFALCVESSVVIRLHIDRFIQMLKENFDIHYKLTQLLAKRVINKTNNLKEISFHNPEHRILSILNKEKKEKLELEPGAKRVRIDFTRQQIADMSGLRVETVIRAMRHLHDANILIIEKGKVFY